MAHDDVRQVGQHLELFQDGKQTTIAGDPIATTTEEIAAIRDALYEETSFGEKYEFSEKNFKILGKVCQKLNRYNPLPDAFTKARIFQSYAVLDAAGGMSEFGTLERVAVEPEQTPSVARDPATGQFQNALVAEYHQMLNDPTCPASRITDRMRTSREFREAVESEAKPKPKRPTEEQIVESEIGTAREFADAFRRAPAPKFLNGRVTIGLQEYTPVELDAAIEKASRLGLL